MVCLEGAGALSHVSVRNRPELRNEPVLFAALSLKSSKPRAHLLEGPVPAWKLTPQFDMQPAGCGGLPRYAKASFNTRFPFAEVSLTDEEFPIDVLISGWSPFVPGNADHSSLPVAGLEYTFTNRSAKNIEGVFSFNAANFMSNAIPLQSLTEVAGDRILATRGGFILHGGETGKSPGQEGDFALWTDDPSVKVNHTWFRGGWLGDDALVLTWHELAGGACFERPVADGEAAPGATLFVPFTLVAGATKTIKVRLGWYVPGSNVRWSGGGRTFKLICDGDQPGKETYRPWYAGRFANIQEVISYWEANYDSLKQDSERFTRCFYDSTLPPQVIEAVAANLTILKSPTLLRQTDGRLWGWEGSLESSGGPPGSCTHVWHYAQVLAHLFPSLERTLRETELGASLDSNGQQVFRTAIPIRESDQDHSAVPAADGQLGGIIAVYRDWRISGDSTWLRSLWPKVRLSLDYCIRTWDPQHHGWLQGPQHNTYDFPLYGPNAFCTSIYLAALQAAQLMGGALADNVEIYKTLFERGKQRVESELFDGEYFVQKIERDLTAQDSQSDVEKSLLPESPEAKALEKAEGPLYQYGSGCLSDGVIGAWFSLVSGIDEILDPRKVKSHLTAVHRHNFKVSLADYANPSLRFALATADEGGLLLCTWPKGGELSVPMIYSSEVWTGIEYQVASHLIAVGEVEKGLEIVRACRRRYDGQVRNPFAEVELGHWYARAMSSYALLQALSGARFDAVEGVLYLWPAIKGEFRSFLATATGFGTVGVSKGRPFLEVISGEIPFKRIHYRPC